MFGTMIDPKRGETFEFGLSGAEAREYRSVSALYVLPLIKIARLCRRALLALYERAIFHAPWRHWTVRRE